MNNRLNLISLNERNEILKKSIELLSTKKKQVDFFDTESQNAISSLRDVFFSDEFFTSSTDWSFLTSDFAKLIITIWSQLKLELQTKEASTYIFHCMNETTFQVTKNQFVNDDLLAFCHLLYEKKLLKKLMVFFDADLNIQEEELIQLAKTIRNISKNSLFIDRKLWTSLNIEEKLLNANVESDQYRTTVKGTILRLKQKNLNETVHYMMSLDQNRVIEDKQVYIDLYFLTKLVKKPNFTVDPKTLMELKFLELFVSLLIQFYRNERYLLNFEDYTERVDDPNEEADLNERKISILNCLLFILNKIAFKSPYLGLYLNNKKLIAILLDFIQDEEFIDKSSVSIKHNLFSNLTILGIYSDENKQEWLDLDAIRILEKFSESKLFNGYIARQINILFGYLVNDEKIQTSPIISKYIDILLTNLNLIASKFEKGEPLKKLKIEYITDTKKLVKSFSSYSDGLLTGTLNLLQRFAVSQNTKKKIYESEMHSIQTIIFEGNDSEKYFALKLLAQLCFDYAKDLYKNATLTAYLDTQIAKECSSEESSLHDEIKIVCKNIIWFIKKSVTYQADPAETQSDSKTAGKHIMISYSWSTQEICIRIKNDLEKLNYTTWMDVDQVGHHLFFNTIKLIKLNKIKSERLGVWSIKKIFSRFYFVKILINCWIVVDILNLLSETKINYWFKHLLNCNISAILVAIIICLLAR